MAKPEEQQPRPLGDLIAELRQTAIAAQAAKAKGDIPNANTLIALGGRLQAELVERPELSTIARAADILITAEEGNNSGLYTEPQISAARRRLSQFNIDSPNDPIVTLAKRLLQKKEQGGETKVTTQEQEDIAYRFGAFPENLAALQTMARAISHPDEVTPHDVAISLAMLMTKDDKVPGGKRHIRSSQAAFRSLLRTLDITATRTTQWPLRPNWKPVAEVEQDTWDEVKTAIISHLKSVWRGRAPLDERQVRNNIRKENAVDFFRTLMWRYYKDHGEDIRSVWKKEVASMKDAVAQEETRKGKEPYLFTPQEAYFLMTLLRNHYGATITFPDATLNREFSIKDPEREEKFHNAIDAIKNSGIFSGVSMDKDERDRVIITGREAALKRLEALLTTDSSMILDQDIDGQEGVLTRSLQILLSETFGFMGDESLIRHYIAFLGSDLDSSIHRLDQWTVSSVEMTHHYQAPEEFWKAMKAYIDSQGSSELHTDAQDKVTKPEIPSEIEDQRQIIDLLIQELSHQSNKKDKFTYEEFAALFGNNISQEILNDAIKGGYIVPKGKNDEIDLSDVLLLIVLGRYSLPAFNRRTGADLMISQLRVLIREELYKQGTPVSNQAISTKDKDTGVEGKTLQDFIVESLQLNSDDRKEIEQFLSSKLIHLDKQISQALALIKQVTASLSKNLQTLDANMIRQINLLRPAQMQAFEASLRDLKLRDNGTFSYQLVDYLLMVMITSYDLEQAANDEPPLRVEIASSRITFPKFWLYAREVAKRIISEQVS